MSRRCIARSAGRPPVPVCTHFWVTAFTPFARRKPARRPQTIVFPTWVSVPVMKTPFMTVPPSGRNRGTGTPGTSRGSRRTARDTPARPGRAARGSTAPAIRRRPVPVYRMLLRRSASSGKSCRYTRSTTSRREKTPDSDASMSRRERNPAAAARSSARRSSPSLPALPFRPRRPERLVELRERAGAEEGEGEAPGVRKQRRQPADGAVEREEPLERRVRRDQVVSPGDDLLGVGRTRSAPGDRRPAPSPVGPSPRRCPPRRSRRRKRVEEHPRVQPRAAAGLEDPFDPHPFRGVQGERQQVGRRQPLDVGVRS